MKSISINIENPKDYQLIIQLLKRLGIKIQSIDKEKEQHKSMQALYDLLDSVKENELFNDIEDPSQWQRDIRNEWN
ncbi:MAG: hypothetical protein EA412_08460 [Chitinophagaceae bacterium]|nr:MAG: hypothetical protein EA412_08460 [Chitinophagaceae bacterium]